MLRVDSNDVEGMVNDLQDQHPQRAGAEDKKWTRDNAELLAASSRKKIKWRGLKKNSKTENSCHHHQTKAKSGRFALQLKDSRRR